MKEKIDIGLRRSFENYVEDLVQHLKALLRKYQTGIQKSIAEQISISEALEHQRRRYQVVQEAYEKLNLLQEAI